MPLRTRLINLARVFLEGRGLPFLGSGVSRGARTPVDPTLEPTVEWMIEQVIVNCCPRLLTGPDWENRQRRLFAMLGYSGLDPMGSWDDLYNALCACVEGGKMGLLCESVNTLGIMQHREVVRSMQLPSFSQLEPTPAHQFIAFLARESLVNEVITTNYDCCQETATFKVAGMEGNGTPPLGAGASHPAVSIASLENYQRHGARRFDRGTRIAVLRVYKINGCAGELAASLPYDPDGNHEDDILLTERQLQHMDDRSWARDLLKDRIRSRALVFSGFGSDEPQVRFTILRLLEEFGGNGSPGNGAGNSIWLHIYDQELSFSQRQIMHCFWSESAVRDHCFTGQDKGEFDNLLNTTSSAEGFEADLFWQVVFFCVFLALMEQANRRNIGGPDFFDDLASEYLQQARKQFCDWLDPNGLGAEILNS